MYERYDPDDLPSVDRCKENGCKAPKISFVDYPFKNKSNKSDLIRSMYYGRGSDDDHDDKNEEFTRTFTNDEIETLLNDPNGDEVYYWQTDVVDCKQGSDEYCNYYDEDYYWNMYNSEFGDEEDDYMNTCTSGSKDSLNYNYGDNYLQLGRLFVTRRTFEYGDLKNWLKNGIPHCRMYMPSSYIKKARKFPKIRYEMYTDMRLIILICKYNAISLLKMILNDSKYSYYEWELDFLQYSAKYASIDVFKYVFENCSKLKECDLDSMLTCFYKSIIGGNNEIIAMLINHIASNWVDNPTLLEAKILAVYAQFCDDEWRWLDDFRCRRESEWLFC